MKLVITTPSIDGRVSGMMLITEKGYYQTVDRWKSQWHGAYYRRGLLPHCRQMEESVTWCLSQKRVITTLSIDGRVSDMVLITEEGYYHTVDRWKSVTWCLLQKRVITTLSIDGRVSDMVLITEKGYCYYHSQTVEGVPGTAPHSWHSNSQVQYCFTSILRP